MMVVMNYMTHLWTMRNFKDKKGLLPNKAEKKKKENKKNKKKKKKRGLLPNKAEPLHIHSFDEAERPELVPTGIHDIFRQCVYYIKVVSPISTTCPYK